MEWGTKYMVGRTKYMALSPGSELAALRRHVNASCVICGNPFVGLVTRLYCTDACRQKAKYRKKRTEREIRKYLETPIPTVDLNSPEAKSAIWSGWGHAAD